MKTYHHIFFDLDNTLWDFDRNSIETLRELFAKFLTPQKSIEERLWLEVYQKTNQELWEKYKNGQVTREEVALKRFQWTLNYFGIEDIELSSKLSEAYIQQSPRKTQLVKGAAEVLRTLKDKYRLHIITNGFLEVQLPKIELSGLGEYFETITTSEECGCLKPCRKIFEFALQKAGANPQESLMVGDDLEGDVRGAMEAGIDAIYFNNTGLTVPQAGIQTIKELIELLPILMP